MFIVEFFGSEELTASEGVIGVFYCYLNVFAYQVKEVGNSYKEKDAF